MTKNPRILINITGGLVQYALSDCDVDLLVIDEELEDDEPTTVNGEDYYFYSATADTVAPEELDPFFDKLYEVDDQEGTNE